MDFSSINWLAVIVCVIVGLISGALWFNPKTFFPIWWKVVGKENQAPGMQIWELLGRSQYFLYLFKRLPWRLWSMRWEA